MRIVIDARTVADHFPGIGRYVYNLLGALAALDHGHELIALICPALRNSRYRLSDTGVRLVACDARPFSAVEQFQVPLLLGRLRADRYHATYYVRPYAGLPCPTLTTLYDLIPRRFPRAVSPRARLLFDLLHRLAIRSSDRLIAISEHARAELITAYRIDPRRITAIPLAADPRFRPQPAKRVEELRAGYDLPERYVLTLGSNKPHKNLAGLLRAWALLGRRPPLVIAGHWDARHPEARALAEQLNLGDSVRFLPNPAEVDLPALYAGAELFIFPSIYEGFGLPPLEAMACGAPVVCGNTSSLPEVVGEAALSVDTTNSTMLAETIAHVLDDHALRERMQAAGLARAALFSWKKVAERTLRIYTEGTGHGI